MNIAIVAFVSTIVITCKLILAVYAANDPPMPATMRASVKVSEIPGNSSRSVRKTISLLTVINYNSPIFPMMTMCTKGMEFALNRIRLAQNLLPNYDLELQLIDEECLSYLNVQRVISQLNENENALNRIPLAIGSICSGHSFTGTFYRHYNFVGVATVSAVPEIHWNRKKYSSFYILGASPLHGATAAAQFMSAAGWRKVALVTEISNSWELFERAFLADLAKVGISALGVFKMPLAPGSPIPNENDIQDAIADLASVNPRVITVTSNSPQLIACWMYRFGLFGPGYTILAPIYNAYQPTTVSYPWCTTEMLTEMLLTTIFIGDVSKYYTRGPNEADWTGLTIAQYDSMLKPHLPNRPEMGVMWPSMRFYCYDEVMFAALWLNATEVILNSRNETLSDWVTSGDKFKQNGREFQQLINKAIYTFRVKGLYSDFEFEDNTTENSKGFLPIIFVQNQKSPESGQLETKIVAVTDANDKSEKLTMGPNKIVWRTHNRLPPPDSIVISLVPRPILSVEKYSTIIGLASVMVGANCFFMFLILIRRNKSSVLSKSTPSINCLVLVGNCIILSHTYFLPHEAKTSGVDVNCKIMFVLLITGASLEFSAMFVKLELAALIFDRCKQQRRESNFTTMANRRSSLGLELTVRRSSSSPYSTSGRRKTYSSIFKSFGASLRVALSVIIVFWIMSMILCGVWLSRNPIRTVKKYEEIISSKADAGLAFQLFVYDCQSNDNSLTSIAPLIVIAAIHGLQLLRQCFIAYIFRSQSFIDIVDFGAACNCVYGKTVLLFASAIVSLIFWSNNTNFHLMVAVVSIVLSALNLILLFVPKLFQKGGFFRKEEESIDDANGGTQYTRAMPSLAVPDITRRPSSVLQFR